MGLAQCAGGEPPANQRSGKTTLVCAISSGYGRLPSRTYKNLHIKPKRACCPIRFAQYGKITKATETEKPRAKLQRVKTKDGFKRRRNEAAGISVFYSFVVFLIRASVFVSFVIFPYCELRF